VLRTTLPPSGVLKVALQQRKRALLSDMVEWVKRQGDAFAFKAEPTPAELSAFSTMFRPEVAAWADAVERAAYGGAPVDAVVEDAVKKLIPENRGDTRSNAVPADLHEKRHAQPRGLR
jgi:hypothetical protein